MNWMKSFLFDKPLTFERIGSAAGSLLINIWAFLMLTVFPLYAPNQYFDLGEHKFQFFLLVSSVCLLPAMMLLLLLAAGRLRKRLRNGFSSVDIAVLCYLAALCLSFLFGADKQAAWVGAEGWYVGLRTQLFWIAAYFCLSRFRIAKKLLLAGHFFGSGAAFLLGVLHRFCIDPFGMYEGISESYYLEFLSTLGQATWFSSYVCTVLVIGVASFYLAKSLRVRIFAGLYCILGFAAVVTQNSDSAFLAMGALIVVLFCISCRSMEGMERFFEILLLMLGSFKAVGLLQQIFAAHTVQLDSLSVFLSQSTATWILFLAVAFLYLFFLLYWMRHETKKEIRIGRWLPWAAVGGPVLTIGAYVLLVWLNTTGRLAAQSSHHYLLFNYAWGNFRGFIWKFAWKIVRELDLLGKCFGVGPDSFKAYCYANPSYSGELTAFYGTNQVLTNAHNEFLNVLVCLGAVGLSAFLALFVTAARRFLRGRRTDALILAGGLAVFLYGAHNLFCYQQVCCTPFLFLLFGMAENRLRDCKAA